MHQHPERYILSFRVRATQVPVNKHFPALSIYSGAARDHDVIH